MAVVTSRLNPYAKGNPHCSLCGDPVGAPPFIVWWETKDFYLCSNCCQSWVRNMVADLIQVDAICRIKALGGFSDVTLHREGQDDYELRKQAEEKAQHEALLKGIDENLKK